MSDFCVRTAPGSTPRTGLPEGRPYVYRGTGREMSPGEIVEHLHARIAARQAGALPEAAGELERRAAPAPQAAMRPELAMCWFCWEERCEACTGGACKCACQDDPPVMTPPVQEKPVRCGGCHYLTSAPGHRFICGGTP